MRIFISYRRSDSQYAVGWLNERLGEHFGDQNVFLDVDQIRGGADYRAALSESIGRASVFLAVIGPTWLHCADANGRRLDNPIDPVRIEIETAFDSGARILPVLLQGAAMPEATGLPPSLARLLGLQALTLRPGRDFRRDTEDLVKEIDASGDGPHRLVGRWQCEWLDETSEGPTGDVVEIRDVVGHKVSGMGFNGEYGSYVLEGWSSDVSVSFLFSGIGDDTSLKGTVSLKCEADGERLVGTWAQYSASNDEVVGGRTIWTRMTN